MPAFFLSCSLSGRKPLLTAHRGDPASPSRSAPRPTDRSSGSHCGHPALLPAAPPQRRAEPRPPPSEASAVTGPQGIGATLSYKHLLMKSAPKDPGGTGCALQVPSGSPTHRANPTAAPTRVVPASGSARAQGGPAEPAPRRSNYSQDRRFSRRIAFLVGISPSNRHLSPCLNRSLNSETSFLPFWFLPLP